jgi:hypothetical protein
VAEYFHSICETLGLIPAPRERKKEREKEGGAGGRGGGGREGRRNFLVGLAFMK